MISVIVAVANHRVIGCDNQLIWHITEDLRRFKAITSGHPVVMGRKTYESIGRPLPNRTNVVISRQADYTAEGCRVVTSLEEALSLFDPTEELFIIGGAEIYRLAIPLADRFYLTRIEADYEGDAYFPQWDPAEWRLIEEERHTRGAEFEHPFSFLTYERVVK